MKDSVFKALADPTRRKILRLLNDREMTAGDLASHFNISLPSMSHHFNVLKEADLVMAERRGQVIYYSLNTTVMEDILTVLMDIFTAPKPKDAKMECEKNHEPANCNTHLSAHDLSGRAV